MIFLPLILSDVINLTQVHNFTVSAQDIFTFRRLSVFGIYRKFYRNFAITRTYAFCTVLLTSQVVMIQNLQPKGREYESTCLCVFLPLFDLFDFIFIDMYHDN